MIKSAIRLGILLALSIAAALTAQAQSLRNLTPKERSGLQLWSSSIVRETFPQNRYVTFLYSMAFSNWTPFEIAQVDVKLTVRRNGVEIASSPSATGRRFSNITFDTAGSMLPFNQATLGQWLPLTIPLDLWTTGVQVYPVIVGAKTYAGPVDLHDIHHLYTKLWNKSLNDSLLLFMRNPSLIKCKNAEGVDTSAVAFATARPEVIKYVATHGGTWRPRDMTNDTNMHFAAANGFPGALDLALARGGNVNALDSRRRSPLFKAITFGSALNVTWLIKHHVNVNQPEIAGGTVPGMWAIFDGQKQILRLLVKAGANVHYHTKNGMGWMHYAAMRNQLWDEVASFGVGVDDMDAKNRVTPLMIAASCQTRDSIIWLLKHGADPERKDSVGRNAFDYSKNGNTLHSDMFFRPLVEKYGRHKS